MRTLHISGCSKKLKIEKKIAWLDASEFLFLSHTHQKQKIRLEDFLDSLKPSVAQC